MKTINQSIGGVKTRGDFRQLNKRAELERQRASDRREVDLPHDHPIWEAWQRLKEYYGAAFTNDPEPNATWIFNLQDLSADQIGNGVRNLKHHPRQFAPNPGEFRDLCLTNFDWETRAQRQDFTGRAQIENLTGKERRIAERKVQLAKLRAEVGL